MARDGAVRNAIIHHLAVPPEKNITEIMAGIKKSRNSTSKAVKALNDLGSLKVLSTYKTYGERGAVVERYGLSPRGIGEYLVLVDYDPALLRAVFARYAQLDTMADMMSRIIRALDEVGAAPDFMAGFYRRVAGLLSCGTPPRDVVFMLKGLLDGGLTKDQARRLLPLLDDYKRYRKECFSRGVEEPVKVIIEKQGG